MATMKFNIGDKVKVVAPAHSWKGGFRGDVFTIQELNPNGMNCFNEPHYGVVEKCGYVWRESELELVEKATPKYKVGDRVVIGSSNVGDKWVGDVGEIVETDFTYEYPYCVNGTRYGDRLWCKVTGYAKFKIGDHVIGNHPTRYAYTRLGWKGVVTEVKSNGTIVVKGEGNPDHNQEFNGLEPKYFDLVSTNEEKIVINHDGKTTTATLYREDGSKVKATAKCSPEDTFDFNVGAKLAMERLMEKVNPSTNCEWRVVNRKPRVGDYIRVTNPMFSFDNLGDIHKVSEVHGHYVAVHQSDYAHPDAKHSYRDHMWNYGYSDFEVVEKVTANEPKKPEPTTPKYYNGKVVCVSNGNVPNDLTIGKIYTFVDGRCKNDLGGQITSSPIKDCDDLNRRFVSNVKFIPLVEDNKPLTIEELRKMDGEKVWLLSLTDDKKPYPNNYCGGWHTVDAGADKLIGETTGGYRITDNDIPYGFLAYRTKPTK